MGLIKKITAGLRDKSFSCKELTLNYLEKAEKLNPDLNAYITLTSQEALIAAENTDKKIAAGESLLPLEGVPFALKDNFSTKGIKTTAGSKMLQDYTPVFSATVWSKLQQDGAVLLGKTNMDEFAWGSSGQESFFGAVKNPLFPGCASGGSSSGSAAAVSAGLAAFSLGTDSGGSIRQPAAFCGLVGLKPTYGAVSRYGVISTAASLDAAGPITRSVQDASLVFSAISAYDPLDSTAVRVRKERKFESLKGLKIGIINEFMDYASGDVSHTVSSAISELSKQGAQIVPLSFPLFKAAYSSNFIISCAEGSSNLGRYDGLMFGYRPETYSGIDNLVIKSRSEAFGETVKKRLLFGTYALSSAHFENVYKKAQGVRGEIISHFNAMLSSCDVIITPTTPQLPFGANEPAHKDSDLFTSPANLCGLPAVSIPCGKVSGVPVSMQIIGAPFAENLILGVASSFENDFSDNFLSNDI